MSFSECLQESSGFHRTDTKALFLFSLLVFLGENLGKVSLWPWVVLAHGFDVPVGSCCGSHAPASQQSTKLTCASSAGSLLFPSQVSEMVKKPLKKALFHL